MSRIVVCSQCGEAEDVRGVAGPDGIRITCGRCGATWLRDSGPAARVTCGGTDLEERPQALTQYSRGNQLSIVGFRPVPLCRVCDRRMLAWSTAGRAVPFHYRPAAVEVREGDDAETGDIRMTPQ